MHEPNYITSILLSTYKKYFISHQYLKALIKTSETTYQKKKKKMFPQKKKKKLIKKIKNKN